MSTRRDLLLRHGLAEIPKFLTLLDRNPHSPTYGCFDRNYWHYRIIDFPSGMAQAFVWPLALAWPLPYEPLRFAPSRGPSNVRSGPLARVFLLSGRSLVVETRLPEDPAR